MFPRNVVVLAVPLAVLGLALGVARPSGAPAAVTCSAFTFAPAPDTLLVRAAVGESWVRTITASSGNETPYNWSGLTTLPPGVTSSTIGANRESVRMTGTVNEEWIGSIGWNVLDKTNSCFRAGYWQVRIGRAPESTNPPGVSGTPAVGQRLTCSSGTWVGTQPIDEPSFEWLRDGIPLASGPDYTVRPEDLGRTLSCRVTRVNEFGSGSAGSNEVDIHGPPEYVVAPEVTGTPRTGDRLACQQGQWAGDPPITFDYEWIRDDGLVVGRGSVHTLADADAGRAIRCRVIASNPYGQTDYETARLQVRARRPPVNLLEPRIEGTPIPGEVLSCDRGIWSGEPELTYTYTWRLSGLVVGTGQTIDFLPAMRGKELTCDLNVTNPDGAADATTSRRFGIPRIRIGAIAVKGWRQSGNFLAMRDGEPTVAPKAQTQFVTDEYVQLEFTLHNDGDLEGDGVLFTNNGFFTTSATVPPGGTAIAVLRLPVKNLFRPGTNLQHIFQFFESGNRDELTPAVTPPIGVIEPLFPSKVQVGPFGVSGVISGSGVERVDVGILRLGAGAKGAGASCRWVANRRGRLKPRPVVRGTCSNPVWLRAKGTRRWSLRLRRRLPRGRYVVYVRAVGKGGAFSPAFTRGHRNRVALRVR